MTPITEVSARPGHRRWVYGRLDPARTPVFKVFDLVMTPESVAASWAAHLQMIRDLALPIFPPAENSSTLSVDRHRTAAEYRQQGIW